MRRGGWCQDADPYGSGTLCGTRIAGEQFKQRCGEQSKSEGKGHNETNGYASDGSHSMPHKFCFNSGHFIITVTKVPQAAPHLEVLEILPPPFNLHGDDKIDVADVDSETAHVLANV